MRDLWRRDQGRGLSAGEKRMLGKARQILVGELALAEPVDEARAEDMDKDIQAIIARHVEQGLVAKPREDFDADDDIDLDDLSFDDEADEDED